MNTWGRLLVTFLIISTSPLLLSTNFLFLKTNFSLSLSKKKCWVRSKKLCSKKMLKMRWKNVWREIVNVYYFIYSNRRKLDSKRVHRTFTHRYSWPAIIIYTTTLSCLFFYLSFFAFLLKPLLYFFSVSLIRFLTLLLKMLRFDFFKYNPYLESFSFFPLSY